MADLRAYSLNPSVVIRSFWGGYFPIPKGLGKYCLNPSVVIRSFWGKEVVGSVRTNITVSIPPW